MRFSPSIEHLSQRLAPSGYGDVPTPMDPVVLNWTYDYDLSYAIPTPMDPVVLDWNETSMPVDPAILNWFHDSLNDSVPMPDMAPAPDPVQTIQEWLQANSS